MQIPITRPKSPLLGQQSKFISNGESSNLENKEHKASKTKSICAKETTNKILESSRKVVNLPKQKMKGVFWSAWWLFIPCMAINPLFLYLLVNLFLRARVYVRLCLQLNCMNFIVYLAWKLIKMWQPLSKSIKFLRHPIGPVFNILFFLQWVGKL